MRATVPYISLSSAPLNARKPPKTSPGDRRRECTPCNASLQGHENSTWQAVVDVRQDYGVALLAGSEEKSSRSSWRKKYMLRASQLVYLSVMITPSRNCARCI